MDITFLISALLVVSATITLTVEAIKKIMDSVKKPYNSTILAVIVSFVISVGCSIGYIIYNSIAVDAKLIVMIIAFVFLSFLCATVGYDKVIKEIFRKQQK
jgi:hypothetical protein